MTTFAQALSNGLLGLTMYLSIQKFNCAHSTQNSNFCEVLQFVPLLLVAIYGFSFSIGWDSISWWLYGQILHPHCTRLSAGIISLIPYFGAYVLFIFYSVI